MAARLLFSRRSSSFSFSSRSANSVLCVASSQQHRHAHSITSPPPPPPSSSSSSLPRGDGETFKSESEYLTAVESRAALPVGFRVGTSSLTFVPLELPSKTMAMTLTVIALDKPSPSFAALFTRNTFPGAPVIVGRKLTSLPGAVIQAIVVNNKVSNVCAPGGVEAAEAVAEAAALALGAPLNAVLPSSTGIIGWRIPVKELIQAMPAAAASLQRGSALPAAKGICTTDLYPKVRSVVLPGGARIVGIAKGAGMIEPGLATMLVYIMTDAIIDAQALRSALKDAVEPSFNSISIDTDMSTSE